MKIKSFFGLNLLLYKIFTSRLNLTFIAILFIASCAKQSNDTEEAKRLYSKALEAVYKSNYDTAFTTLTRIDEEFPYTAQAKDATILLVYVSYKRKEYSELLPIIDIYIKTNPGDENIPYLLYLKGLSFYNQIKSYKRDKEILIEFKQSADFMYSRYPDSKYTADLLNRYDYIIQTLLLGDLDIAIQYHKSGNCGAAIPRYLNLLNWNEPLYSSTIRENLFACFTVLGNPSKAEYFLNYPSNKN